MKQPNITLKDDGSGNKALSHPRYYSIEFLRIFAIFSVILLHVGSHIDTDLKKLILEALHSNTWHLHYAVELFFLIGGFFLYHGLSKHPALTIFARIKKLWLRLIPGMLFAFVVLAGIGRKDWWDFTFVLPLLSGTALPPHTLQWGDWFIGTYFWSSCLYLGILSLKGPSKWVWVGILVYVSLRLYGKDMKIPTPFNVVFWIDMLRSVSCMGLGITAAFLRDRLPSPHSIPARISLTGLEGLLLYMLFNSLYRASRVHFSLVEILVSFMLLLICFTLNAGYISTFLNRMKGIWLISRYTFSFLIAHMIMMGMTLHFKGFHWSPTNQAIFVIGGGILLGIIEYHIVERLFSKLTKRLIC